jgi:hypothetical protein
MSVLYGLAVVEGGKAAVLLLANLLQLGSDEQWCGWAGGWSITNWQTGTIHEAARRILSRRRAGGQAGLLSDDGRFALISRGNLCTNKTLYFAVDDECSTQ